jgi:hypothetical protein
MSGLALIKLTCSPWLRISLLILKYFPTFDGVRHYDVKMNLDKFSLNRPDRSSDFLMLSVISKNICASPMTNNS